MTAENSINFLTQKLNPTNRDTLVHQTENYDSINEVSYNRSSNTAVEDITMYHNRTGRSESSFKPQLSTPIVGTIRKDENQLMRGTIPH